ncbi:aminotransferase [Falsiroseomonas stagni]|uniref:aspartate transaminase n=1 Tax=Falsiroseomonas stagni DSM 19981 TaxID=1123062 RepID=A0A1I4DDV4_9PROT|nr:aminotransferase [Falsiroseomonas stagni]SFK91672.1 Aspartate/methionine/tyrosine aminotransferase [Falsiroseomonas stagni DSM 19981]
MSLSARIRATAAPPIPAARAWAARYAGQAGPALDLTQAVPGYPPPPELLAKLGEAAGSAACAGYGPIAGDTALREALAEDMARFYGAPITGADVAITAGCNLAFAMTMAVLAAEGEGVLIPTPWYFNHEMALTMQGVRAVPLPTRAEDGFVPSVAMADLIMKAATIKAVVLVSPNNPTGAVYPPEVIRAFADLCRRRGAMLVLDETYRDFLRPDQSPPHALFQDPDWGDVLVHLYSFSKSYCIPGHRLGAIACGPAFRAELDKALDTFQICPPRPAQTALSWAIPALRDWRDGNRALMADRARAFRDGVSQLPGWRLDAIGTYFAYLRLPEGAPDALASAEKLAAEQGLMGLPGPFFGPGQDRHIRLAFANAGLEVLAQVPGRLANL